MGINTGATLGSLLVPWAATKWGWNVGFGLPALFMVFGLVQFQVTRALPRQLRRRAARQARQLAASHRFSW